MAILCGITSVCYKSAFYLNTLKKHTLFYLALFLLMMDAQSILGQTSRTKYSKPAAQRAKSLDLFNPEKDPPFLNAKDAWVDSVFATLTPE